jgi:hypothetical protein
MTKHFKTSENLETGDHIFRDITEAIRWKKRLSKVRGPMLSKCPLCHGNLERGKVAEHRQKCPGAPVQTDNRRRKKRITRELAEKLWRALSKPKRK